MKDILSKRSKPFSHAYLPCLMAALFLAAPAGRAGLTVDIHLYHDSGGYYFYPWLSGNTNPPNFPDGHYMIASPQIPTGGSQLQYQATNNLLNFITGGGNYYGDFDSFLYGITNGQWSIWVTNGTTTQYQFRVAAIGFTSNSIGAYASITFPTNNQLNVSNVPTFTWIGPINWGGKLNVQDNFVDTNGNNDYVDSSSLTPSATSWIPAVNLPNGTNSFSVNYTSNLTATVIASPPTNHAGQAISGWVSSATMETSPSIRFVAGQPANPFDAYLVARYDFEITNAPNTDSSGNGNDANCGSGSGSPTNNDTYATNAAVGAYAREYFGNNAICFYPNGASCFNNISNALYGGFSLSAWVNTTNSVNADFANAYFGSPIWFDYNSNTNSAILSITGSKAAFTVGNPNGTDTVLHSTTSVNDGHYHFIAVTRNQTSGLVSLYVDGQLEATGASISGAVIATATMYIAGGDAGFYSGLLDDVRVYSTELSATDVTILAGQPTGGPVVHYDFDEGTVLAADVSGNGNNIVHAGNFGGSGPATSSDTAAGSGSIRFDGGSYLTASSNLLAPLAGEFSVSLWLKTSQNYGNQGDLAWMGAGVISADSPNGGAKDLIPVALTGGQVAFNIGDGVFDNTLNSSATVNDDAWHHIVVTRSVATGERQIFIDGTLDSSDVASTVLLNSPVLLTIGAKSDASNPNPASPDTNGSNGYAGLLDDVQIYDRVLSSNAVAFLYQNPGAILTGTTNTPYPVDVSLQFGFNRSQDPNWGEIYGGGVSFNSVSPAPTTTNSVHSPHDYFNTVQYPGGGFSSGAVLSSLDDVLNEFTNGFWKIYINQGSPTQQVYSFQISVTGLNPNLLQAARILSPTNGALNVRSNAAFYWNGPTNFSLLHLDLAGVVNYLSLPLTTTNWAPAPALTNGNQLFDISYVSNNFPGVTFTTPADVFSNPVRTWTTTVNLSSEAFAVFVVGPNVPQLINPTRTGTNFQFSFISQSGVTNTVQYRTNLVAGMNWQTYTNITGDGSLKTVPLPLSIFSPAQQGFIRVSAQ